MSDRTQHIYYYLTHPILTSALLLGSAALGVCLASSPLKPFYHYIIEAIPFPTVPLSVEEWINQGLMTLFFASLALEIRYDISSDGPLHHWKLTALPLTGAIGGMAIPALIAAFCGAVIPHSPGLKGWAIPTATDAAFTVPILTFIPNLPYSLRSFLMALAIFDDLGAIVILALFYGHSPHLIWLSLSLLPTLGLLLLGWRKFTSLWLSLPLTCALWIGLFKTGIEPTLAGVVFGLCLPPHVGHHLHKMLALPVGLVILPLFALISTGIDLRLFNSSFLLSVPLLGAGLGLWIGKPLGVSGAIWLANRSKLLPALPALHGRALIGIGMICGIGFTISLLITSLAYSNSGTLIMQGRCGVLIGSILSGCCGWALLRSACRPAALKVKTSSLSQK